MIDRDQFFETLKQFYIRTGVEANLIFFPHSQLSTFNDVDMWATIDGKPINHDVLMGDVLCLGGCRCIIYPGRTMKVYHQPDDQFAIATVQLAASKAIRSVVQRKGSK